MCPLCGSQLSRRTSAKKVEYDVCEKYPTCRYMATPETTAALVQLREDNQTLSQRLDEARGAVCRMADKYAEARGDKPSDWVQTPVAIGEYVERVAAAAIERSRRKRG